MTSRRLTAEHTSIEGPAGALQALIETPALEPSASAEVSRFAVACHPHPLYGGTLDNKVVFTLVRAFQELRAPTIRFNFRGVGASAGHYDEGAGETEDALAVVAHGRARWPGAELWLAGFSFGGAIVVRAAESARPARLVAVSPAVTRIPVGRDAQPAFPWLIVQGDADEVVEAAGVLDWARSLTPAPEIHLMPGAGHFFHGRLNELRDVVVAFARGD